MWLNLVQALHTCTAYTPWREHITQNFRAPVKPNDERTNNDVVQSMEVCFDCDHIGPGPLEATEKWGAKPRSEGAKNRFRSKFVSYGTIQILRNQGGGWVG